MESIDDIVYVKKVNESFLHISCPRNIAVELSDYFAFDVPNAKFMPDVQNKFWDGKIRLFNIKNQFLNAGLYLYLHKFCKDRNYELQKIDSEYGKPLDVTDIDIISLEKWIGSLNLFAFDKKITPHDYQIDATYKGLRYQRKILQSATSSGKSLIIYLIARWLIEHDLKDNESILIVVPNIGLIGQLFSDFKDYSTINGWNVEKNVATVSAGLPKNPKTKIVISTWQSIYKLPANTFSHYRCIIGDEVHQHKADCISKIALKCSNAKYRIGLTGTLDDNDTNKMTLEGLFGSVYSVITTKEMIDRGLSAELKIKCICLEYSDEIKKSFYKKTYHEEVDGICNNAKRNQFISNLVNRLVGNTLVLFNYVDNHGKPLYNLIKKDAGESKSIFFVYGGVSGEDRNNIRSITEKINNSVIVASYGTFSTGINIKNLHNIVMASPTKSKIRNLQSIGRGLRITDGKNICTLYDIVDNLSYKSWKNYTLKGFLVRSDIYNNENFDYSLTTIKL